jgi:hypothetical protein
MTHFNKSNSRIETDDQWSPLHSIITCGGNRCRSYSRRILHFKLSNSVNLRSVFLGLC